MNNRWLLVPASAWSAFALQALFLIENTPLLIKELYSVGKSFQPSLGPLLRCFAKTPIHLFITFFCGFGVI